MNKSGIVLIIIGALFIAHNHRMLQFGWLRQCWPLILIGPGIWSVINHKPGNKRSSDTDSRSQS
jgi:uncharacterized integral membrane protein